MVEKKRHPMRGRVYKAAPGDYWIYPWAAHVLGRWKFFPTQREAFEWTDHSVRGCLDLLK